MRFKEEAVNPMEVSRKTCKESMMLDFSKGKSDSPFLNYNYVYLTIYKDKTNETSTKKLVMHESLEMKPVIHNV